MNTSERWARVRELEQRLAEAKAADPAVNVEQCLESWEPDPAVRSDVLEFLEALDAEAAARRRYAESRKGTLPERIAGFAIRGVLGRGGSGTVYEAEWERNGETQVVALKLLHAWLEEAERGRFLKEQRILTFLDHPGIARILDAGLTEAQQPYLVMERVHGRTLDAYCREEQLSPSARVRLMAEVCEVVEAAHRKLVVHLDLKPANIMVTAEGRVKLLDFGTAKLLDPALRMTTTRPLTPVYASPEQLRGEAVSTACDTYAAGLILYELLTGAWPHAGRSSLVALAERAAESGERKPMASAAVEEAARGQRTTLEQLRRYLKGDLEAIVAKALSPAPERYASIRDLGEDLRRFLNGRPVVARKPTAVYRLERFLARNRKAAAASALALVVLLALAGYAAWEQRERLRAAERAARAGDFLLATLSGINPIMGGRPDMKASELIDKALARLRAREVLGAEEDLRMRVTLAYQLFSAGRPAEGFSEMEAVTALARKSGSPLAMAEALNGSLLLKSSLGDCQAAVRLAKEADPLFAGAGAKPALVTRLSYLINRAQIHANCERDIASAVRLADKAGELLAGLDLRGFAGGTPARLYAGLIQNGRSFLYSMGKRMADARKATSDGLRVIEGEPDSAAVRLALLRSLAQIEGIEGNSKAAADALERAVASSKGVTSPFEELRLKLMLASRLAEAGERERPVRLVDETLAELDGRRSEVGGQEFMLLIDAMRGYMFAGECGRIWPLLGKVRSGLPPAWKSTRLMVEGVCLAESGRKKEALPLLEEAMRGSPPAPNSTAGKRLAKALREASLQ